MVNRDFEANPYTPHEQRVANFIDEITGLGGGDDPIEFLITSYRSLLALNERLRITVDELDGEIECMREEKGNG